VFKEKMSVSSDFKDLLKHFNDNHVKYLVVGGYAVIKYTEPRYTKDLDLWIRVDPENAAAVFQSLREFGAPLVDMTAEDFAQEGYFYQMGVPPVRVDILMSITGLTFDQAWKNRVEADFDGIPVSFISREDLITSKSALGRPQDLIDVELLSQGESLKSQRG
jgi:predicted nucleotidyltransferase